MSLSESEPAGKISDSACGQMLFFVGVVMAVGTLLGLDASLPEGLINEASFSSRKPIMAR